jgi:hypothetical protein
MHVSEARNGTIRLHHIEGIARRTGIDENGNWWTQFEVDTFAEQEPGECCLCGAQLESGWLCLDGGDEVCECHVEY